MAEFMYVCASMERGALTDYFTNIGSIVSRNTTTPISGTADFKLTFPTGASVTWNGNASLAFGVNARKISITVKFSFSGTPAQLAALFTIGSDKVYLSTNKKLQINTTESTMAALTANTQYVLEVIWDMDWRGANLGSIIVREHADGTLLQVDLSLSVQTVILTSENQIKAQTGPGMNIFMDDLVIAYSTESTFKAPWLNALSVDNTSRVPIANGTYNTFTGVSQTTNKYLNVDETTVDTTDFNNDGEIGVVANQTYTFTNVASYSSTIRAAVFWKYTGTQPTGGSVTWTQHLIRSGTSDYLNKNIEITFNTPKHYGFDRLSTYPITAGDLNSIEAGWYYLIPARNGTNLDSFIAAYNYTTSADGPTNDGVWLNELGSSAGSMFPKVSDANNTTYMTDGTVGHRQGFTLTQPAGSVTQNYGDTIVDVQVTCTGRTHALDTTDTTIKVYCIIGGTRFYSASTTTFSNSTFTAKSPLMGKTNPSSGLAWQRAEIDGSGGTAPVTEWGVEMLTVGTSGVDISEFTVAPLVIGNLVDYAEWMEVVTGDAPTNNGNIPGILTAKLTNINQAKNRSNTY